MDLDKLDNVMNELEQNSEKLKNFTAIYSEINTLQSTISTNTQQIEKSIKTLNTLNDAITKQGKENNKQLTVAIELLEKKIEELYKENKTFQRELDLSLTTRLDKHKSDIQLDIRNEGNQIQRAFETTLNSNFNMMESKIKENFALQNKEIKVVKVLLLMLIVITIGIFFYTKLQF